MSRAGRVEENFLLWKCLIPNNERLLTTFTATDRSHYTGDNGRFLAYQDTPLPIGYDATISAPHMHAMATQLLEPALSRGATVLDVGCGSGYLTAVFARLVGVTEENGGTVVGIDYLEPLVELTRENIRKDSIELLMSKRLILHCGDGWNGYEAAGPYDAIHVGAAASSMPETLIDQLKPGGLMVVPVGKYLAQKYYLVHKKSEDDVVVKRVTDVSFVPLVKSRHIGLGGATEDGTIWD